MKICCPARILIIGASHTGKTYLVRKMLMRGDFGKKRNIKINVVSPVPSSLDQDVWTELIGQGYNINKYPYHHNKKPTGGIKYEDTDNSCHLIWIIDDLDKIGGRGGGWIGPLFTTESHHSNESVIMICHKLNSGCPEARDSADYLILTNASNQMLNKTLSSLDLDKNEKELVRGVLDDSTGVDKISGRCFNHILLLERIIFDTKTMQRLNRFYTIPTVGNLKPINF